MRLGIPTNSIGRPTLASALRRASLVLLAVCLTVGDPVTVLAFGRAPIPEYEEESTVNASRGFLIEDRTGRERSLDSHGQPTGQVVSFPRPLSSARPAPRWQLVVTSRTQPGSIGAGAYLRC